MKCFSKQLLLQALEEAKGSREKKWSWCNSESTLALDFISTDIKKWLSDRSPTVSVSPPLSLTLTPSHTHTHTNSPVRKHIQNTFFTSSNVSLLITTLSHSQFSPVPIELLACLTISLTQRCLYQKRVFLSLKWREYLLVRKPPLLFKPLYLYLSLSLNHTSHTSTSLPLSYTRVTTVSNIWFPALVCLLL